MIKMTFPTPARTFRRAMFFGALVGAAVASTAGMAQAKDVQARTASPDLAHFADSPFKVVRVDGVRADEMNVILAKVAGRQDLAIRSYPFFSHGVQSSYVVIGGANLVQVWEAAASVAGAPHGAPLQIADARR